MLPHSSNRAKQSSDINITRCLYIRDHNIKRYSRYLTPKKAWNYKYFYAKIDPVDWIFHLNPIFLSIHLMVILKGTLTCNAAIRDWCKMCVFKWNLLYPIHLTVVMLKAVNPSQLPHWWNSKDHTVPRPPEVLSGQILFHFSPFSKNIERIIVGAVSKPISPPPFFLGGGRAKDYLQGHISEWIKE
jgi:hypothetical protein